MEAPAIYTATGRRKTSVAQVRLKQGSGKVEINGRELADYFPTPTLQNTVLKPLEVSGNTTSFDVIAKTSGGGIGGQAGALSLALSRALLKLNGELRPGLKTQGLLTRDPRMKERKKAGQPGARKRFQFSKR